MLLPLQQNQAALPARHRPPLNASPLTIIANYQRSLGGRNLPGTPVPGRRVCGLCHSGPARETVELTAQLAKLYFDVQNPAACNRPYSKAVLDFTEQAMEAYECGFTERDLREQLLQLQRANELDALKGFDIASCLETISLVWVTLMLSPRSLNRWSTAPAVSEDTLGLWQGFVKLIVNGYFERRMAWFPLDRLQLEINAVQGRAEPQEIVAERARIIFTVLEHVHPQFPKDL